LGKCLGKVPHATWIWEDIVKMDLGETSFGDVNWSEPAKNRVQYWALVLATLNL
jgi:hypothetical protein